MCFSWSLSIRVSWILQIPSVWFLVPLGWEGPSRWTPALAMGFWGIGPFLYFLEIPMFLHPPQFATWVVRASGSSCGCSGKMRRVSFWFEDQHLPSAPHGCLRMLFNVHLHCPHAISWALLCEDVRSRGRGRSYGTPWWMLLVPLSSVPTSCHLNPQFHGLSWISSFICHLQLFSLSFFIPRFRLRKMPCHSLCVVFLPGNPRENLSSPSLSSF